MSNCHYNNSQVVKYLTLMREAKVQLTPNAWLRHNTEFFSPSRQNTNNLCKRSGTNKLKDHWQT